MGLLPIHHKLPQWLKSCVVACALSGSPLIVSAADEIAFIIDTSGSMVQNDPKNLRKPALKLATQMLPSGSKAGVWLFDTNTQRIVSFEEVNEDWKNRATRATSKVNSRGQFTNIEKALESGSAVFSPDADSKTIILLTDGQVDVSKDTQQSTASRNTILNTLLPSLAEQNIHIHTIALSDNTDKDLLQRLSVGSNGMYSLARSADDLMSIFLQVFDQSIESDQVPLEDNKFTVDPSISEFTVLVFRKPGSTPSILKSPSGQEFTKSNPGAAQWFSDELYDLVTISTPEAGQWSLDADIDPENRVTIVSDLELNLEGLPNNIIQGQQVTLEFFLSDDDGTISAPTLLSLLDIDFEQSILTDPPKVLRAKVTSHTQGVVRTPSNGIFSAKLSKTLINGEHQFSVYVDGKTFKRTQTKRARVLSQVMEHTIIQGNGDEYQINLVPINGLTQADSLDITASIKKPDGQIQPTPIEKTKFGSWVINVPPDNGKELYKGFITIKGKTLDGDDFEVTQGPINVDYTKTLAAIQSEPAADLFDTLDQGNDEKEIQEVEQALAPPEPEPAPEETLVDEPLAEETPEEPAEEEVYEEESAFEENEYEDEYADDTGLLDGPEEMPEENTEDTAIEETEEESGSNAILYGVIGFVNLLLIGAGAFFGRRWFKRKKEEAEAEDQALLDAVNEAKTKATEKLQKKPEAPVEEPEPEEEDDELTKEANKISEMLDSIDDQDETA